jgi:general L-amino acid transport system permease protein
MAEGFVRSDFTAPAPPPAASTGVIAWISRNLFSSIGGSVMTLACVVLLFWIVPPLVGFVFTNAHFSGENREACLVEPGQPLGACWAFVSGRFGYFFYGQYPVDERWRVNLVWLAGAALLVWLLTPRFGAKGLAALLFFAIFPFFAFWFLTGGMGLAPVPTNLWGGLLVTLVIASVGIVVSLPLGIVLALGRRSTMPIVKFFSVVFIEFVRGVPLPDSLLRVLIGVALFASAYMAEVVRGGLQAMPKGQYEGAMALGLNYPKMMTFIILPQALKITIPGIVNTFIGLFKDTSLVAIVGIFDLMKTVEASNTDPNWATPVTGYTGYLFAAIIYFIFCFGMSRYSLMMERRLDTGHKR